MRTRLVVLCLTVLLCPSCAKVGKTIGGLVAVRAAIIEKFGEEDVDVREASFQKFSSIIVTFINSPLNDKTDQLRAARAQATAEIVKARYPSIVDVSEIRVHFVRYRTRFVVINYTQVIGSFTFDHDGRSLDNSRPFKVGSLSARANYSKAKDETEISLELLLEGHSNQGFSTFPHFTLAGDATKRQSPPPDLVTFDFASYSPTRRFEPKTDLKISVDNEVVYEKEVSFSASKAADGQVAEFLYLPVPYDEFRQIGNANDVTITIGDEKFTLEREQIIALKNMNAYIKPAAQQRTRDN